MNSNKLLSFELRETNEELEIHCNQEGIDTLIRCLELVKKHKTHEHLITDAWGGDELTSELQGQGNKLVNKVTIRYWP
ncbi:MAG TPA: Imm32 family immunity protein [Treponemataceae bacterium]|nr:Imm32 family immunity protein [Treponemataceae bacterium]